MQNIFVYRKTEFMTVIPNIGRQHAHWICEQRVATGEYPTNCLRGRYTVRGGTISGEMSEENTQIPIRKYLHMSQSYSQSKSPNIESTTLTLMRPTYSMP